MGSTTGSREVIFSHIPDATAACALLDEIAQRTTICNPRCVDKPLVLYGAGNLGHMAGEYFAALGIAFDFVVDANPAQHRLNPFWQHTKVLAPTEVSQSDRENSLLVVCISTVQYAAVQRSLVAQGWRDVVPFYDVTEAYRDRHPLGNGWFAPALDEHDISQIKSVLVGLADDVSRAHHLQFLSWRRLREDWLFQGAPVTTDDRFFIPQIVSLLHDHESFLDLGAHHGSVSIKFSQTVAGRFKEIYAVEPDSDNLSIMSRAFADHFPPTSSQSVQIRDLVVAERPGSGTLYDGLGYATQLSSLGRNTVEITTIDALGVTPSFLKLHLEGWELAALKGGMQTVHRCRPIIAATAYHNRLGMWELPQYLMRELEGYNFLIRLHGWCGTALVLYAIPQERAASTSASSD